jgi:hypothetical protein
VLDVSQSPSSITARAPGYIDRHHELIVGLQTDAPLKAGDDAERWLPHGAHGTEGVRLRARSPRGRGLHEVPQDAQPDGPVGGLAIWLAFAAEHRGQH